MRLGFIGTGKIASSVITGICNSKISFKKILVSPRNRNIAQKLKRKFRKVSIAKNKYKKPLPVLFMGMNTTDVGAARAKYDDMKWIEGMGGEMVKFVELDVKALKAKKEGATEYYLDGVECKIRARAEHGIGKFYKAASGHAFAYSACFPHYHPQIIDFITKKLQ